VSGIVGLYQEHTGSVLPLIERSVPMTARSVDPISSPWFG
jgi:hypothetical protein